MSFGTGRLTFLTGQNTKGKSTLMKALSILGDSFHESEGGFLLKLDGRHAMVHGVPSIFQMLPWSAETRSGDSSRDVFDITEERLTTELEYSVLEQVAEAWLSGVKILVDQYVVLFHAFFLDDGIWLVKGDRGRLSTMVSEFDNNGTLQLTWSADPQDIEAQQEAVFLDATFSVTKKGDSRGESCFTYSLFRKPHSTRTYVAPSSFHPRHVSKGTAKAELMRILTASYDVTRFLKSARNLCGDLRALGYSARRLAPMMGQVGWVDKKAIGAPRPPIAKSKRLYFSSIFRPGTKELEAAVNWKIPNDVQQGLQCGRRVIMARRMGPRLGTLIGKVPRYEGEALPFNPNLGPP